MWSKFYLRGPASLLLHNHDSHSNLQSFFHVTKYQCTCFMYILLYCIISYYFILKGVFKLQHLPYNCCKIIYLFSTFITEPHPFATIFTLVLQQELFCEFLALKIYQTSVLIILLHQINIEYIKTAVELPPILKDNCWFDLALLSEKTSRVSHPVNESLKYHFV